MKRVVITGFGAITPLGNTINEFWQNIVEGKSGAAPLTKFDSTKFKTQFGCEVKDFHPEEFLDRKELRSYDLFTQYAIAASDQAILDSGLNLKTMSEAGRSEIGVIWASGNGGIETFEVLEDLEHALKRNATIYAEIIGGGMAADAYHLTGTHPDGLGAMLCIQKALADAGIEPSQIDYENEHATSTPMGDISELKGIKRVFGEKTIKVTGTKSMTGHLLGAVGAIESIISILSVRDNIIPATINTLHPDKEIPQGIDLVLHHSRYEPVNYVLNNTFGFGGHTASSIFKKYI
jgi:3-oxoacyl-(acyl-carrier-protein) synthase